MRRIKLLLTSAGALALALVLPLFAGVAQAATVTPMACVNADSNPVFSDGEPVKCDLSIKKEVSVNGGSFQGANTPTDAVTAAIGDELTWRITVDNTSDQGAYPYGTVIVNDVLPAGLDLTGSTATQGNYSSDSWSLLLNGPTDTYPMTLNIFTKATSTGAVENTASLSSYAPLPCSGACKTSFDAFSDSDLTNNQDSANVRIPEVSHVLGDSTTLAATGQGTTGSMLGGTTIIASAIGLAAVTRRYRAYKLR